MSAEIIQAQYDSLTAVAQQFGKHAQANTEMSNRIRRAAQALQQGGWQGRGATAFFNELNGEVLPAMRRLVDALERAQKVTLQIKTVLQEAEREAAEPFCRGSVSGSVSGAVSGSVAGGAGAMALTGAGVGAGIMAIGVATPGLLDGFVDGMGQGLNAIGGWVDKAATGTWGWIQDHRNEVASGAAVVAAGVAVVATGGLAAPIIAGAIAAGGATLAINAVSPRYPLMDGVISNTISGAFIGYGVGTAGAALGALRAAAATPWAASVGGAAAQVTQLSQVAAPLARVLTYAPPALQAMSGAGMVVSSGGVDILLPEPWEPTAHTVGAVTGIGASLANTGLALAGNDLIKYAWAHPRTYPPGGKLSGGGNNSLFWGSHIFPQRNLGNVSHLPADLLDDAVILPSAASGNFIPNLHTAAGGYDPALKQVVRESNVLRRTPTEQVDFVHGFARSFVADNLLARLSHRIINLGAWGGLLSKPAIADKWLDME